MENKVQTVERILTEMHDDNVIMTGQVKHLAEKNAKLLCDIEFVTWLHNKAHEVAEGNLLFAIAGWVFGFVNFGVAVWLWSQ